MLETMPIFKITVRLQDEITAISHLKVRGFRPTKIDRRLDGTVTLLYAPSTERVAVFSQSLPDYLDPKMDIVTGASLGR